MEAYVEADILPKEKVFSSYFYIKPSVKAKRLEHKEDGWGVPKSRCD